MDTNKAARWFSKVQNGLLHAALLCCLGFAFAGTANAQAHKPVKKTLKAKAGLCGAGTHCVNFSWTASTSAATNPTLTYNLYRLSGGCPAAPPATEPGSFASVLTGITGTTATDSSSTLIPGTYCYQLSASVGKSESVPSNMVVVVIQPTVGILPPGSFIAISAQ
jgi:hypothetical protein